MALDAKALEAAAKDTRSLSFSALTMDEHRDLVARAVTAYLAALGDGWRLVPVERTEAMHTGAQSTTSAIITHQHSAEIWAAMLAAAPTPPEQTP